MPYMCALAAQPKRAAGHKMIGDGLMLQFVAYAPDLALRTGLPVTLYVWLTL